MLNTINSKFCRPRTDAGDRVRAVAAAIYGRINEKMSSLSLGSGIYRETNLCPPASRSFNSRHPYDRAANTFLPSPLFGRIRTTCAVCVRTKIKPFYFRCALLAARLSLKHGDEDVYSKTNSSSAQILITSPGIMYLEILLHFVTIVRVVFLALAFSLIHCRTKCRKLYKILCNVVSVPALLSVVSVHSSCRCTLNKPGFRNLPLFVYR